MTKPKSQSRKAEYRSEDVEDDKISERFNSPDADVTFRSADGVIFKLHSSILKTSTENLDVRRGTRHTEPVVLDETSDALTTLFQFVYPSLHPDLEGLDFPHLLSIATAAEKYRVYSAMNVCKIRIKDILPAHAKEIFYYGMNFKYHDIVDIAVPLVIHISLKDLSSGIPLAYLVPWRLLPASNNTNFGSGLFGQASESSSSTNTSSSAPPPYTSSPPPGPAPAAQTTSDSPFGQARQPDFTFRPSAFGMPSTDSTAPPKSFFNSSPQQTPQSEHSCEEGLKKTVEVLGKLGQDLGALKLHRLKEIFPEKHFAAFLNSSNTSLLAGVYHHDDPAAMDPVA
ncbi:hypothetical protein H0H92_011567 [Tricholoma furcatifolium]|nr:hypothetical protein H0H92_011567 [Tricholoma furcatifolium]